MNRLFYVEDEHDIREIAILALRDVGGFEVETAGSGTEALQTVGDFGPDAILLDVMMPGMDGPGTFKELQKMPGTAGTPVIFMTAKVQSYEVSAYRQMGAIGVIAKPFDPMKLADQVREILRRARGIRSVEGGIPKTL